MNILISLIPWFFFWIFLSMDKILIAALCGLAGAFYINARGIKKGNVKILEVGTLIFFLGLTVAALIIEPYDLARWVDLSGDMALLAIVSISLILKKPFTLQYAREDTPPEFWDTPDFLRANYIITSVWLAAFFFNTSFAASRAVFQHSDIWVDWLVSLSCFGSAITFTNWYRKRLERKSGQNKKGG